VPYDPEFPTNSGRLLKIQRQVNFPKLSGEDGAINAVKNAKLIVQGKGKSGRSVIDIIQKLSNQYFVPLSWSAKQDSPDGPWIVTLNCIDGGKQKTAQWEYNPETETIKYLDPLAKLLSFL
jgi:hypothetical protein